MTLVKTDLGFLRIIQKFKIVGRETNNNKALYLKGRRVPEAGDSAAKDDGRYSVGIISNFES